MLKITQKNVITVGTDCSGIDSPILALRNLSIPFKHIFSCEMDKYCRQTIEKNFYPKIHYTDITKREMPPYVDLYISGFPCQPFSNAGDRKGFSDERGEIFWHCLKYIKTRSPKYFILENVKALLHHDKGKTWQIIRKSLEDLKEYNFYWKILNTRHYGIPQNRERLYMIGIKKTLKKEWSWNFDKSSIKNLHVENIQNFIDHTDNSIDEIRADVLKSGMLEKIPKDAVFVDFSFKKHHYPNSNKYSPTIAADSRLWCVPKKRYANIRERSRLQGLENLLFPEIPKKQIFRQIGNSMSVNVLTVIFEALFGNEKI